MAGRRKKGRGKGRWITPSVAEELAREGRLHGPNYQRALRMVSRDLEDINRYRRAQGYKPLLPDAYSIHLKEALLASHEAGERARARDPETWQEIDEIQALARKHNHRSSPAFDRDLAALRRLQAERRKQRR